ncbi:MAG TPA: hypothetical protein VMU31_11380 [Rhizomicrobium sp.]|nr:hypothetical protein [Rhizomicrobium sp.]
MPSHLRIFFWLIAAIAAYWVVSVAWVMMFPPAEMVAALARVSAALREQIRENAWRITIVSTAIRVVVFVGLAWLAAFRRQNWARWALLAVFVLSNAAPYAAAVYFGRVPEFLLRYRDLQADIIAALIALALVFAFTGNARGAFKR